jgi:glycosyltransferase involved in cell wall biosynthesis
MSATSAKPVVKNTSFANAIAEPIDPLPRGSLLVFSDDWGRHPSSAQHLISRLAADYQVLWVNTIGTRAPKLDFATLRRAAGKVMPRRSAPKGEGTELASDVRVVNPLMWPWFRRPIDREFNRRLLSRALRGFIASLSRPVHAVTTISLVADLVGDLDVDQWVYYCVDDLAAWPGLDQEPLESMERELVAKVDAVVTVSPHLQARLRGMGRDSTVVSHGVDLTHWESAGSVPLSSPALLALPRPWIVFWGLIDERLDGDWLLRTADSLKSGTIVLAGPVVSIDSKLLKHPRVYFPGPLSYQELPSLAREAAVLTMPYRLMPATEAMQPLKLKEYMATGLPCVVSRLPATEPWQDCVDIASNAEQFADLVLLRLQQELLESQRKARLRLAAESWEAKSRQFEAVLQATRATPRTGNSAC